MVSDLPIVSVWQNLGTEWGMIWQVRSYTALSFGVRHNDIGQWSMTVPAVSTDGSAAAITKLLPANLVTIDWRGSRLMTGLCTTWTPGQDESSGSVDLTVSGLDTLGLLSFALQFADPTKLISAQPYYDPETNTPPAAKGPAETVVFDLIAANLRDRFGLVMNVPASQNRGLPVRIAPQITPLWPIAQKKANHGGIGLKLGLVNKSGTRADLTLGAYVPVDRSKRVRLSQRIGALRSWVQTDTAPTLTVAFVAGAGSAGDQVWKRVTTTDSIAAATAWGWKREGIVDGPDAFDSEALTEAGEEALQQGAMTTNLALTAGESDGLQAFRDYNAGDIVTAQLAIGTEISDTITGVDVTVGSGYDVTPILGDPNAHDPLLGMATLIRDFRRLLRR